MQLARILRVHVNVKPEECAMLQFKLTCQKGVYHAVVRPEETIVIFFPNIISKESILSALGGGEVIREEDVDFSRVVEENYSI